MIYLDNAATSFPRPEAVLAEMDRVNRTLSVNAGRGSYRAAREAAEIIHETRDRLLDLFHAKGRADVVLTSSVTQAVNEVLDGLDITEDSVIYLSIYEHNAVARTVERIRKRSRCRVEFLPVDKESLQIDIERTKYLFSMYNPDLVIMNAVSNVTGYRLPIQDVFTLAKEYGSATIADAAQAAGLIDLDFRTLNADVICFAGHKTLLGPFGIGGFLIRNDMKLKQVFSGGTGSNSLSLDMPEEGSERYEAGSQNIVAIAGLNAALAVLDREAHEKRVKDLTDYLLDSLRKLDHVHILGVEEDSACIGIVSFVMEGYDSNDVGQILDEEFDIAVRTGFHCAPFIHEYLEDLEYHGTIRIGIGHYNTKGDIDSLISALETI